MAERYHQRGFVAPPDATTVLLVRHGASWPAEAGKPFPLVDGHADPPLAEEGIQQAQQLAERLAPERIDKVFVTTLQRTVQTAAPLAQRLGLQPEVVADLCEVNLGDWETGEFRIRFRSQLGRSDDGEIRGSSLRPFDSSRGRLRRRNRFFMLLHRFLQ